MSLSVSKVVRVVVNIAKTPKFAGVKILAKKDNFMIIVPCERIRRSVSQPIPSRAFFL